MKLYPPLRRLVAMTWLLLAASPLLAAQAQTDVTDPTGWLWYTGVPISTVSAQAANGFRVVDIEIDDDSPLTVTAALVHNSGNYAKNWWWYVGQTSSQVNALLAQNNARLIDVEPYNTSLGVRYAVVMVRNTGGDYASGHGWYTGMTSSQVISWVNSNSSRRILDIQPYWTGSGTTYTFIWVNNSGTQQSGWWYYINVTGGTLNNLLAQNNARLIDLERNPSTGNFDAIMVPGDGHSTYHFYNISSGAATQYINQYASRIIDVERYPFLASYRYHIVMRQNDDDLTIAANNAMRSFLPLSAKSGLSLVRLDNGFQQLAGVQEQDTFEPASLIKTAHHYTAMRRVSLGLDDLASPVTVWTGMSGSCPTGTAPVTRDLSTVLSRMMEQSSNTDTEAIHRRYGAAIIESTAASAGANSVELNHVLGCLCGQTRNEASLDDFAEIHNEVADGILGSYEDTFHSLMSNGTNFGMGAYNTSTTLTNEINAAGLTAMDETAFRAGLKFAHKGGSYTCLAGPEEHRSRGAYVRVPHRAGCFTFYREYFIGAWVNDATTASSANDSVGVGISTLYAQVLRDALASWTSAGCSPFLNYCTAVPNSTGASGHVWATGSHYIASNSLTLRADDLPTDVFAFLLVGTTSDFVANPGGSLGNLCVGGSIGRYWDALQGSGATGTTSHLLDLQNIPGASSAGTPVQAGQTLYFQWWHRDTVGGPPASNFPDGLRVTFI